VAEHLSDEEQLESFKRWWKENGIFTIVAVVFVAGGYFGWEFWKDHRQERAETASVLYQKMMVAADVEPGDKLSVAQDASVTELAENLRDEYPNTQYARYGALLLAKVAVEKGDLDAATEQLQWVADGADEGLMLVATLRLARVEAARGNLDLAISMLNIEAQTLASAYAEARGDFYLIKGDKTAAYESYQQALQKMAAADNRSRALLELKLSQVAPVSDPVEEQQDLSEGDA
jgi:predicted negative regulator of RcsB-dependent stress response